MGKQWSKIIEDIKKGKTLKDATVTVPLAVRLKTRQFKTTQISNKQQQAISRG